MKLLPGQSARILMVASLFVTGLANLGAVAQDANDRAAGRAAQTSFGTKCSGCHGADGRGNTEVGRTLKAPDLASTEVQKQTDAQLAEAIANGKDNRMPPFKSSLSPEQIQDLVQYVRDLGAAR